MHSKILLRFEKFSEIFQMPILKKKYNDKEKSLPLQFFVSSVFWFLLTFPFSGKYFMIYKCNDTADLTTKRKMAIQMWFDFYIAIINVEIADRLLDVINLFIPYHATANIRQSFKYIRHFRTI